MKSRKKTFTFTSNIWWYIHIIPDESTVPTWDIVRNSINWIKTIKNSLEINFASWFWTTKNRVQAETIRNSTVYWDLIFETDSKWNDITQSVIDWIEWINQITEKPEEVYNPYKSLPKSVLNKLSLKELTDACISLDIEVIKDASKADLINALLWDVIEDAVTE